MRYHHTQTGHLTILAFVLTLVLITIIMALGSFNWIAVAVTCILVICLILFSSLTVIIQDEVLEIRFGPGLIRKRFHLKDIESCQSIKNHWYYGWGIRRTSQGWLFNVSGFSAVEIKLKSGKKYRIGTDVPAELERAIRKAIDSTPVLS